MPAPRAYLRQPPARAADTLAVRLNSKHDREAWTMLYLAERSARGDVAAFDELVEIMGRRLERLLRREQRRRDPRPCR